MSEVAITACPDCARVAWNWAGKPSRSSKSVASHSPPVKLFSVCSPSQTPVTFGVDGVMGDEEPHPQHIVMATASETAGVCQEEFFARCRRSSIHIGARGRNHFNNETISPRIQMAG